MKPAGDITKLPKWAQEHIASLERSLAHAREKLAVGPEDSDTFADPYSEVARPLGERARIVFAAEAYERGYVRGGFVVYMTEATDYAPSRLRIMGRDSIAIRPQSSHVVEIELDKR